MIEINITHTIHFNLNNLPTLYYYQQKVNNVRARRKGHNVAFLIIFSYPSIDEMWEVELNNKKPDYKVVDQVGSA